MRIKMGIRGLTTFIDKNKERYFQNYELHDTYLVIDGNCLACQLYKFYSTCYDCFGGDYDKYGQKVEKLFNVFKDCNITPIVIFDGGYENRKLKTHFERMRTKLYNASQLTSATEGGVKFFPLFIRQVFIEIIRKMNVKLFRCDFEADLEITSIARALNCPILSYDSDFYVSNVLYIPLTMLEFQLQEKTSPKYKYLPCRIYNVEKFLEAFQLDKSVLPLIGVLLGNDYIKVSKFNVVYNQMKKQKQKHMQSPTQKRIYSLLKWLQGDTYETALQKILSKCKQKVRERLQNSIKQALQGYIATDSKMMQYLGVDVTNLKKENNFINYDNVCVELKEEAGGEGDINEVEIEIDMDIDDSSILTKEEKLICENIPGWFLDKFRVCLYPAYFMDYIVKNRYFCTPQVENYANHHADTISHPIIRAIHAILTSGERSHMEFVARGSNSDYKIYKFDKYEKTLPKLHELRDLNKEVAQNIMLDILEFDQKDILKEYPAEWSLYIIAIIYWLKNASPPVHKAHLYALLLSLFVLHTVDKQIGRHRSFKIFNDFFNKKIKTLSDEMKNLTISNDLKFFDIPKKEALLVMKDLIGYFNMDPKLMKNHKLYDIYIIDVFAQFQSCILHILDLNFLLNQPFTHLIMSDFYNGTFIYNICTNFIKRTDIDNYLKLFLKSSPVLLDNFNDIANMFTTRCKTSATVTNKKRRRRKKKAKNDVEVEEEKDLEKEGSNDEMLVDEHNRFNILQ